MKKGDQLRLVLYTTDFEHTVRDKTDYELTIDLEQSSLDLPTMNFNMNEDLDETSD